MGADVGIEIAQLYWFCRSGILCWCCKTVSPHKLADLAWWYLKYYFRQNQRKHPWDLLSPFWLPLPPPLSSLFLYEQIKSSCLQLPQRRVLPRVLLKSLKRHLGGIRVVHVCKQLLSCRPKLWVWPFVPWPTLMLKFLFREPLSSVRIYFFVRHLRISLTSKCFERNRWIFMHS